MALEAMDLCLQLLKESNENKCSVRDSVLILSHITFPDCRTDTLYSESGNRFLVKPLR